MTPQGSELDINLAGVASRLLEVQETVARARVTAQAFVEILPATTVTVYLLQEDAEAQVWSALATAGEEAEPDQIVPADTGTLGAVFREQKTIVLEGRSLVREEYAHLSVRRTVKCLACIPLVHDGALIGSIEILSFDAILNRPLLQSLEPVAEVATQALISSLAYEEERHNSLTSITRLTQFYDIEKVFSSTLEMDELLPLIGGKMREMLECQAVNVWMVQGDGSLLLMQQAGDDPTTQQGMSQKGGDGIAGDVSDNGETVLIADSDDERLARRNSDLEEGRIQSIIVAPLMDKDSLVGVVEAVNRLDSAPFDEDDLFVLTSLNETASIALHNAGLLQAERKVEILEALVKVSAEITSTLDLDHVLDAVVNGPSTVIPYERAAIALEQRGRVQLKAVSGIAKINPADPDLARLQDLLEWASASRDSVFVDQHEDEVGAERPETRAKFQKYFSDSGMRAFHSVPLADDDGLVGILSFESSDPDFLNSAQLEMIKVLAGQATVALRNASLYREVPFIDVLQPILEKKRKFLAMEKGRRLAWVVGVGVALLFFAVFPLPLRVDGPAVVAPAHSARVQPEVPGIVQRVNVREGEAVKRGTVLASLGDWQYRAELAGAQAKYNTAISQMDRALASNDGSEAGIRRTEAEYWATEVSRARERLDRTLLRSPIDGLVATPHIEDTVGRSLAPGDTFAEVVDTSVANVDVAIDERDVPLLRPGEIASVKLEGFPTRTFRGEVMVVSPKGLVENDQRVFYARLSVPNSEGLIRAGMQGRSKVATGWKPAGEVFFRRPTMWVWSKIWSWVGW